MVEKETKPDLDKGKSTHELKPGDVVKSELLLGWQQVAPIPKLVAHTWFSKIYPNATMNDEGTTPNEQPMKYWQEGFGIVVGKFPAYPGYYKLNILHKDSNGYTLRLSREDFLEK